jgi:hypothetical protein
MSIIGISGRMGSGKDTVGKIIQALTYKGNEYFKLETIDQIKGTLYLNHDWEIKKFAGKLKEIASLLTGVPVERWEDQEFKRLQMNPEWGMTYREFLQTLGTECLRDNLSKNIWAAALFADYKDVYAGSWGQGHYMYEKPKWIITDMRFPNELEAVKKRRGISIRVNRPFINKVSTDVSNELKEKFKNKGIYVTPEDLNKETIDELEVYAKQNEHPSETALDNAEFDYEIINDAGIPELIEKVKEILIKEKLI